MLLFSIKTHRSFKINIFFSMHDISTCGECIKFSVTLPGFDIIFVIYLAFSVLLIYENNS